MLSYIAKRCCPKKCIHNSVKKHICIRMTQKSLLIWYLYTTKDKLSILN